MHGFPLKKSHANFSQQVSTFAENAIAKGTIVPRGTIAGRVEYQALFHVEQFDMAPRGEAGKMLVKRQCTEVIGTKGKSPGGELWVNVHGHLGRHRPWHMPEIFGMESSIGRGLCYGA